MVIIFLGACMYHSFALTRKHEQVLSEKTERSIPGLIEKEKLTQENEKGERKLPPNHHYFSPSSLELLACLQNH